MMSDSSTSLADEFVSFALARPAQFGPENFAGDAVVKQYVDAVIDGESLNVKIYISWECPPDVSIVALPEGNALIRSERLDTLLVEFHRLQEVQRFFDGPLAQKVISSQVLRWMCECLIGYRNSALAIEALVQRPDTAGLELGIWNPFRDETLASIPLQNRIALQCFSLGHELGHLVMGRDRAYDLYDEVDGLSVMSHLDYDVRAQGYAPDELDRLREFWNGSIDATQLLTEINADLFAFDTVAQFLHWAEFGTPEQVVDLSLAACEALIYVYNCKETCRLLALVASGVLDGDAYDQHQFLADSQWAARSRAVGRRAGITLTRLEGERGVEALNRNVTRVDALMLKTQTERARLVKAMEWCEEAMLQVAREHDPNSSHQESYERLSQDPDLRLELYYLLIAFGCSGAVDVSAYLTSMSSGTHHVAR